MRSSYAFKEKWLLVITAVLLVGGLFLVSSASVAFSQRLYGSISFIAFRQLLWALVGLAAFFTVQLIPYKVWKWSAPFLFLLSLILLSAVFLPDIGFELKGAHRWIQIGSFNFQPSEIAKLCLVIFLAWWLDRQKGRAATMRYGALPFLGIMVVVGVLIIKEPDLGTLGVISATGLLMFFAGGGKLTHLFGLLVLGVFAILAVAWFMPHSVDRLRVFWDSSVDPGGIGYQVRQASIGIGSGGFWGVGYGESRQKEGYLPEPIGDSIFAVVAEEFGFLGASAVVIVFVLLLWRGIIIAKNAPDTFAKLLALGITGTIVIQAFINIGAISGLLPLTGIPLPFISYGGTALAVNLAGLGMVYQIAKHS
ncbi:MAG: putative lipid II flippase FtsW [Candidatus Sungbacteria bacterium]|nr:putative lipid II flippase FtsW [Candidatus Sungbacteria bacterium]